MELQVFVEAGCGLCVWAIATVNEIRRRFPSLVVTVVDIGHPEADVPDFVFAVPSYVLDGRIVFLGNPAVDELDHAIRERSAACAESRAGLVRPDT